jgi:hypothetical protein
MLSLLVSDPDEPRLCQTTTKFPLGPLAAAGRD